MSTSFLGDSFSRNSRPAKAAALLKEAGTYVGKNFRSAKNPVRSSKIDTVLVSGYAALTIADVFVDKEELNESEFGQIVDDVLDYGGTALAVLSFIPLFRLVSVPVRLLRTVLPISQVAKFDSLRKLPFLAITNKRLFAEWKRIRPAIKGLTDAKVTRDIKSGTAFITNKLGEAVISVGKRGISLSPKMQSALKKRGLVITGGTVGGLLALGLTNEYNQMSTEQKSEADALLEEFLNMIITLSGYIDDTDEVEYEIESRYYPYFGEASFFEVVSNYEWYKDRSITAGNVKSAAEFDLILRQFMVDSLPEEI